MPDVDVRTAKGRRSLVWEGPGQLRRDSEPLDEQAMKVSFRYLGMALVPPFLYTAARGVGLLEPGHFLPLAVGMLVWLLVFGAMAMMRHRALENRAHQLWAERLEFEKLIKSSQNDLRVIVERIQVDEARRLAQAKFIIALRVCPYAVALQRLDDGTFLDVNPAFEKGLGYARAELLGHQPAELGLWQDPEREESLRRLARRRVVRERRVVWRHRGGERKVFLLSAGRTKLGETSALLTMARDVTERAAAVERLRATVDLLERARAIVVAVDAKRRICFWNEHAESELGWKASEVLRRPLDGVLEAPQQFEAAAVITRHGSWSGRTTWRHRTGAGVELRGWGIAVETRDTGEGDLQLMFFVRLPR